MYSEITQCRICGNTNLIPLIELGTMAYTGIFPQNKNQKVPTGPLSLVKCEEDATGKHCGLVQLKHNFELEELYGDNYGYRSGLNPSMVKHLGNIVRSILGLVTLSDGDLVIDIGSNDSTLLQQYPEGSCTLVGIDPTGIKFRDYYPPHIDLIPEFFPSDLFASKYGNEKAKIITSIAMFYDLTDPLSFAESIYDHLDDNGIWAFEQSYMPTMLQMTSYDTICHEHLEYYALKQIKYITDKTGFHICDVQFNDTNGGSFFVIASKRSSSYKENIKIISDILQKEAELQLSTTKPFKAFEERIFRHKTDVMDFFNDANNNTIFGYGASTKGNVILQYCGISSAHIPCIAEVNEYKFNRITPGSCIPIISESEAKSRKPDYLFVLPWHFRENILQKEQDYLKQGGRFVFPLPKLEVI
ncbi:class I SAM-dependent methyltransferase [Spirochaetota bacterium]